MRHIFRNIGLTVVGLVVVALVAPATPPGRALVAGLIARAASGNGLTVTIEGPSGWPPFWLGADMVILADGDGRFAEIDNLAVDVRLSGLLTGTIAFDSIAAARVAIERAPHLTAGGSGGSVALPFAVDDLQVARLELGAPLAGRPAAFSLTGSAAARRDGSIDAHLDAKRTDGGTGTLTASIARENGDAALSIDVALSEGADGVLLGLMGRAGGPGYALTAKTGVSGGAVSGAVTLKSEEAARFDGQFALSPAAAGGQRLELNGNGNLAELVPPAYADLLGGSIDVAIDADFVLEDGKALPRITVRKGAVTTGSVRAEASGSLGDAVANLGLTVNIAKPGGGAITLPGLASPASFETMALTGTVAPKGEGLRLDLIAKAAGLTVAGVTIPGLGASLAVEARGDDPLASTSLPFALRVEAAAVQTETGRIESVAGAPVILSADGVFDTTTLAAKTNAKLSLGGGMTDFSGTLSGAGVAGKATVAYADVAPLVPLIGRPVSGALAGVAQGTFTCADTQVAIDATVTDFDPGNATAAKLLAGQAHVTATVSRPDGALSISDARVDGGALKATGAVTLADETVTANLEGTIADLALIAESSSGAATFKATVSGARERPTVNASIAVAEGRLLNQPVDGATATFDGAPGDGGWQGALTLTGGFGGKPLSGTATARLDPASGLLAFPDVNVAIGGNRIAGSVSRTAAGLLDGTLAVDAPDLQSLAALALVEASGAGTAQLTFAADGGKQALTATFTGRQIAFQSLAAGSLSGDGRIDDLFGAPMVKGSVSATGMALGNVVLDTASATASIANGVTAFQAKAKGPDLDLAGSGNVGGEGAARSLRIDTLSGRAYGSPVQLSAPVAISLGGGPAGLADIDLALGGGHVRIDGAASPDLDINVTIDRVAASIVNGFAPQIGAAGTVSGHVAVTGRPTAVSYDWQATWSSLAIAATRNAGLPPLSLTARGKGTATSTTINATVTGAGLSLTATGTVPFKGAGLSLAVGGTAPLTLLALRSERELRLAGNGRVDLRVTGTLSSPQVAGSVDLADATIADLATGLGITGASGRIAFDGRRATTTGIVGHLSQGGDVTVTGAVDVTGAGLPANLAVHVANGRYADGNLVNAQLSAELTITGPLLGNGTVAGTIDLGRTEIQLPDKLGGAPTAIPVRHVNPPPGFTPPQVRESSSAGGGGAGGGLNLDIALNARSGVFVRGFGVDSELGGALRLAGTSGDPQTIGAFSMTRGRIELIGKRFDFTRGSLTFAGGLVPRLDFAASTQTSDAVVTANVTGPANDPKVGFTSSPALPEEEILSRLLFDRQVGSLSPLQAAQLVDAVAQMTGALGGTSLFTRVRQATGLDDLDIRQNASGGTTVGVGKRISDRVSLGVEAGDDATGGRVSIDIDITKTLKARGEAGRDGEGKVGLSFEKEY